MPDVMLSCFGEIIQPKEKFLWHKCYKYADAVQMVAASLLDNDTLPDFVLRHEQCLADAKAHARYIREKKIRYVDKPKLEWSLMPDQFTLDEKKTILHTHFDNVDMQLKFRRKSKALLQEMEIHHITIDYYDRKWRIQVVGGVPYDEYLAISKKYRRKR